MRLRVLVGGLLLFYAGDAWAGGRMLVSFTGGHRVVALDAVSGTNLGTFSDTGGGTQPLAMAFGPDRHLYVSDIAGGRIVKIDGNSGEVLGEFARVGGPACLSWEPDGNLYVGDVVTRQILRLDGVTGAVTGVFGDALNLTPNGMTFNSLGRLMVLSSTPDGQLQEFDPGTGTLVRSTSDPQLHIPFLIAAGPGGDVFVATISGSIFRFTPDGAAPTVLTLSSTVPESRAMAFGPGDGIYLLHATTAVLRFDSIEGTWTVFAQPFAPGDGPSALIFTPDTLPTRMEAIGGDGQTMPVYNSAREPLTVLVTGVNGPMAEQPVRFAIVEGMGYVTKPAGVTNAQGLASTSVTGYYGGPMTVRAKSGASSADFHLTVVDFPLPTDAQIRPGGVLHAARRTPPGVPGSALARGGLMVIQGLNLGPERKVDAGLPYPLELPAGGTKVEIIAAGLTSPILAPILSTSSTEVWALVPSQTPESRVQLRVSFGGNTSLAEPATVAAANFGVFADNQKGSGPAVALVLDSSGGTRPVTLLNPARAGDTVILRGTGLGPFADDMDTALPPPPPDQVLVAGTWTPVVSAGRAADLPGVEEIRFVMPDDVPDGCYVPLATRQGQAYSNFVTVAKAGRDTQGGCAHPLGLTDAQLGGLNRAEHVVAGVLGFYGMSIDTPDGASVFGSAGGSFGKFDSNSLFLDGGVAITTLVDGACSVSSAGASVIAPLLFPSPPGKGLDAGVLRITGPEGQAWSARQSGNGGYNATQGSLNQLDVLRPATPGRWSIQSDGGSEIGEFEAELEIPAPVAWVNKDSVTTIDRSADLKFTWDPEPGESADLVLVSVLIMDGYPGGLGDIRTQVTCAAEFNTGFMIIPANLLSQLPASASGSLAFAYLTNSPFDRRVQSFAAKTPDGRALGNNRVTSVVGQAKVVELR